MRICDFNKNELIAYCYSELNQAKTRQIKEHLAVCKHCLSKVEAIEKTLALIKQQKLKQVPSGLLDNYTQQVRERLNKEKELRPGLISVLRQGLSDLMGNLMENLRPVSSPRFIPVLATVCVAVLVFVLLQEGKKDSVNLINQDIALLDELQEDVEEIFVTHDEEGLFEEIENLDTIMLAQVNEEAELEDILDELELLGELGEEGLNEDDVLENLKMLDEVETETSVG